MFSLPFGSQEEERIKANGLLFNEKYPFSCNLNENPEHRNLCLGVATKPPYGV